MKNNILHLFLTSVNQSNPDHHNKFQLDGKQEPKVFHPVLQCLLEPFIFFQTLQKGPKNLGHRAFRYTKTGNEWGNLNQS